MTALLLLILPASVSADDADAKLLKPFVASQTAVVAAIDLSSSEVLPAAKTVLRFVPDQRAAEEIGATIDKLRAADVKRLYVVVTPNSLLPAEWIYLLAPTPAAKAPAVRAAFPTQSGMTVSEKDGVVFFGPSFAWDRIERAPAGDDVSSLMSRIERMKPSLLSVIANLPEAHRKALAELAPQLPLSLGGGPTAPLIAGFDALELNVTNGDRPSLAIVLHARDAAAAKQMETLVAKGLSLAQNAPPRAKAYERAARLLAAELKPTLVENRVEMSIDLANANVKAALKGLTEAAGENSRRHKVTNDLKQIALAMHNYHDANKSFPPSATVDKDGKPLLSWRVHILPYLDQNELYKKFKLDEPWDGENNRKLIDQMPDQYLGFGSSMKEGKTTILGIAGAGTLFPKPGQTVRINDIKDGTSNTIMCRAAPTAQAVVWTKPDDLSIADAALLSKVGAEYILSAFCDGSVQTLPLPSSLKGLLPYITINGREVIERPN
jgi:hypothetical protein